MPLNQRHIKNRAFYFIKIFAYIITSILTWDQEARAQDEQSISSGWESILPTFQFEPTDTNQINTLLQSAEALRELDNDSAMVFFSAALRGSIKARYTCGTVTALSGIGSIHRDQGNYVLSEQYYQRGIQLCKQTNASHLLPSIYNAYGKLRSRQGRYTEAAELYYKGIEIAEQLTPRVNADYIYNNLAVVLTQFGRSYREVLEYLKKAEASATNQQNHVLHGIVLINKGIAYNIVKAWDSSRHFFHQALDLGRSHNIPHVVHMASINMGITYLAEEKPNEAVPYLLIADSIKAMVDPYRQNITYYTLGEAYLKQGKYKQAEQLLLEGMHRAITLDQPSVLREIYLNLGKLYGITGSYKNAFTYLTQYIDINNKMAGETVVNNVNQLEVKYRTAEKDKEIAEKKLLLSEQERAIERRNSWIIVISAGIAILALVLIVLYNSYRHKRKRQAQQIALLRQQQELLQKKQEIAQLKAMMKGEESERIRIGRELHDGVGGLLSAVKINFSALQRRNQYLANTNDFSSTLSLLDEATSELRKTAHNLMPEILLKSGLKEAIATYCERMQRGQDLHIDVQCYGDLPRLDTSFELAVYRVIQELIHNIVKHAKARTALVQLNWQDNVFNILVEDDGIGLPQSSVVADAGIGLSNIQSRVHALNGAIDIESSPGNGTTICITFARKEIPLQLQESLNTITNR